MDFLGGNILPPDIGHKLIFAGIALVLCAAIGFLRFSHLDDDGNEAQKKDENPNIVKSLFLFCYTCFIKPHRGDGKGTQQEALESFYQTQAGVYDVTRKTLLKGREDMLALVAAQLLHRARADAAGNDSSHKRVWVDVGGGTGWNIEAMAEFVNVPEFFSSVYLVDFSPSLCEVAQKRFARLKWDNVHVICEDARRFRLEDYENDLLGEKTPTLGPEKGYFDQAIPGRRGGGADLITMSYSLSMIPDYYSVVDSLTSLLAPSGIIGAIDFYVQSKTDYSFRNYTGGIVDRHINFFGRAFWRSWFELDRVGLEASRRDYLEYRFGTVLSVNSRNYSLGSIPYYIWVGCPKQPFHATSLPHEVIERIDAMVTESPHMGPSGGGENSSIGSSSSGNNSSSSPATALGAAVRVTAPEMRSKAFQTAISNLSANLPLPAAFHQNHHWRIYYDEQLAKHRQFNDEYIYAFTWEDTRVDERLLDLGSNDVVLAITSAGDNILSYALQSPARIHAVDLNPAQNHLLELKVAAYGALGHDDFWKLFGEGRHQDFRSLLVSKLSPHLSSRAFQYWLSRSHVFTSRRGRGLYDTGGSRHAIRILRYLSHIFGFRSAVADLLAAKTLNEQREIWGRRIRPSLLSRLVSNLVVAQESFLWAALGVPKNQLAMIEADHAASSRSRHNGDGGGGGGGGSGSSNSSKSSSSSSSPSPPPPPPRKLRSHAVWHYMVDTLDPVAANTHIAADNPYYHVCLAGRFSRGCHPDYLSPQAHARLSRPGAFDGLRIHTDEVDEVLARMAPGSLTVAVVMDSMDWFDPRGDAAAAAPSQIRKLNRALAMGGRVLLRSSALRPWYIDHFEALGFAAKRHGARTPGACIDRVNMYASCWVCVKVANLPPPTPAMEGESDGTDVDGLLPI